MAARPRQARGTFGNASQLDRVSSFLNLRVGDIRACYSQWKAKGAEFLTEPLDNHDRELRCYMRDPDGYLIEVGQYSRTAIDHFKEYIAGVRGRAA